MLASLATVFFKKSFLRESSKGVKRFASLSCIVSKTQCIKNETENYETRARVVHTLQWTIECMSITKSHNSPIPPVE